MSFSDRNSALLRILEISESIRKIESGRSYSRLRIDLKTLERARLGDPMLPVHSLENPDETVHLVRSSEVSHYIERYTAMIKPERDLVERLKLEKSALEHSLFKKSNVSA